MSADGWAQFKRAPELDDGRAEAKGAGAWSQFKRAPELDDGAEQPPPAPPKRSFMDQVMIQGRNVATGLTKLGDMANIITVPLNRAAQSVGITALAPFAESSTDQFNAAADQAGLPKPETTGEHFVQSMVEGATQGLATGGAGLFREPLVLGAGGIAKALAPHVVSGAAAGGGAELAADAGAPPWLQLAAGLAAGHVIGGAPGMAKLASAGGRASAPLRAAVSPAAAEAEAGLKLATRASDPQAARVALEQPAEIVPGSKPTTFQQTGDFGLGELERDVAKRNPGRFAERRGEQNAARVGVLTDIETDGDPNALVQHLRSQIHELDAVSDGKVSAARRDAEAATSATGAEVPPEQAGSSLRSAVESARAPVKDAERSLWDAVDPDGTLTGNATHTVNSANEIAGSVGRVAKPMEAEEAAIFDAAKSLKPLSPVHDLIDLRSRVSAEMRAELTARGSTPTYARLSRLRSAIGDNLATTISQTIAHEDAAVARGVLNPADTTTARLQAERGQWYEQRSEARAAVGGSSGRNAPVGPSAVPGPPGAEVPAFGRSGNPSGGPGVPSDAPSFDAAAGERLSAATDATKARVQTFDSGVVGQVLKKAGGADMFRLPNGEVASKFFHPGPTAFDDIQALTKAAGADRVMPVLQDYAATSLRRAAAPDGVVDPNKFATWRTRHADALRALPQEVQARFADAAKAGEALADATARRNAVLKEAQTGAIGKIMGLKEPEDVVRSVGRLLSGATPVADMKALAKATIGNEAARNGLRQAVAQSMLDKVLSNAEAGTTGVSALKSDTFQSFFAKARPALHLIFKPDEVRSMAAVAEDVRRADRSIHAVKLPGQSNTAQDLTGDGKGVSGAVVRSILNAIAAVAGSVHGPIGAIAGFAGAEVIQSLRAAGIARIDELVTTAMLHPEVAAKLLAKAPKSAALTPPVASPLAKAIRAATKPKSSAVAVAVAARRKDEVQP